MTDDAMTIESGTPKTASGMNAASPTSPHAHGSGVARTDAFSDTGASETTP